MRSTRQLSGTVTDFILYYVHEGSEIKLRAIDPQGGLRIEIPVSLGNVIRLNAEGGNIVHTEIHRREMPVI